ncbi:hypothetical protein [Thermomonospora catenispora]|uniref:hypothetical protein n=1 Tax=Thermomonospora catenispora TaxID=2493090 RepID=UPI0011214A66|nr:hypothetical protein [Thermomonospora catenispora]TNY35043.1 hypothetical protein EIO00_20745 [Thermomonospora catenispora]
MTTDPDDKYGEILRRALHAEAEKVEPAPDGLERIRAGIERRSKTRTWDPALWLPDRLRPFTAGWARPILAVAGVMLIVALGVSAPQTIDRITSAGDRGLPESRDDSVAAASGSESRQPSGGPASPADPDRPPGVPVSPGPTEPSGAPANVACAPDGGRDIAVSSARATSTPTAPPSPCPRPSDPPSDGDGPGTPTTGPDVPTSSPEPPEDSSPSPAPGQTGSP